MTTTRTPKHNRCDRCPYEVTKFGERKWGVVLRLAERQSIDMRVYRTTKKAATADAAMLNREHAELNPTTEG